AELRVVHFGDKCGHELAVRDRPIRWSAHCLLGEASPAIEAGAIKGQLDRIHHRMPREDSDESEHRLRSDSMSVIEDGEAHASISPGCGTECRERILVLTSGLANRGTDHKFHRSGPRSGLLSS